MEKIYIGTAYYPEHWKRERWSRDVDLMKKAGMKVVRLAELAWAFLEPEDGRFEFEWLDEFIALAYENGIETVLGTPTEVTPTWINHRFPEVTAVNREGRTEGGRGNNCYNSKELNHYVQRIVRNMAEHYKDNPAVIGWQLDNEIRATKCYCPVCRQKFREWLTERYQTIDGLNQAWGTCFWSQTYHEWEEVDLPSQDKSIVSTSQILDHFRFASKSATDFLARQGALIKKIAPHQFVSHNSLGLCEWVNLFDMGKNLDYMGLDSYPYVDDDYYNINMAHDLARGTRHDCYWIWEQKNGFVNYHTYNLAITPGLVRLWTYQDLARGANGVVYYRWRSNLYNREWNPNGILRHDGTPRDVYGEITQLNKELEGFSEELAKTRVEADAAIVYSYDQMWDEHSYRQYKNISYQGILQSYYKVMVSLGLTVDLVDPMSDLSAYKLVLAPALAVVKEEIAENLSSYVGNGGRLVLGVRSGIKTWSGAMTDKTWPGMLRELAGVCVKEFEVLPPGQGNEVVYEEKVYPVGGWLDRLTCESAIPKAYYSSNFYAGDVAVAENHFGNGKVLYIGQMECDDLLYTLMKKLAAECNIRMTKMPKGVFMTRRSGEGNRYLFVINYNSQSVTVESGAEGVDMLTGERITGDIGIPALDLRLIRMSDG